jgi:hypothetical protein
MLHVKADVPHGFDRAVVHADLIKFEQRHGCLPDRRR